MEDFLTKLSRVEQCEVNALIMEHASDTAEQLTELECKLNGIECYVWDTDDISSFTDEAQDIFNIYYDDEFDKLYTLLEQLILITNI